MKWFETWRIFSLGFGKSERKNIDGPPLHGVLYILATEAEEEDEVESLTPTPMLNLDAL